MQNTKLILNGVAQSESKSECTVFFRKERYVMCDNCFKLADFVAFEHWSISAVSWAKLHEHSIDRWSTHFTADWGNYNAVATTLKYVKVNRPLTTQTVWLHAFHLSRLADLLISNLKPLSLLHFSSGIYYNTTTTLVLKSTKFIHLS